MATLYFYSDRPEQFQLPRKRAAILPSQAAPKIVLRRAHTRYLYTDPPPASRKQSKLVFAPASTFLVPARRRFEEEDEDEFPVARRRRVVPSSQPAPVYVPPHRSPTVFVYPEDDDVITVLRRVIPASGPVVVGRLLWRRRRMVGL